MSAYLCDDAHISALAGYAAHARRDNVATIAACLRRENERSLETRYGDKDFPPFRLDAHAAESAKLAPALQVLKAAQCYAYQACEHEGWEASPAKRIVDAIVARAITCLPGYDDAAWGWPETPRMLHPRSLAALDRTIRGLAKEEAEAQEWCEIQERGW